MQLHYEILFTFVINVVLLPPAQRRFLIIINRVNLVVAISPFILPMYLLSNKIIDYFIVERVI